MRPSGRKNHQLRQIQLTRHFIKHIPSSVLVEFGHTKVICSASLSNNIPRFLKGTNAGWLTGEYGMLPSATHTRGEREAARGKQSGRTQEIQRLIGRSLRAAIDLRALGENTIILDCDVIQADGSTRTAAITGSCVALIDLLRGTSNKKIAKADPLRCFVAAVSVGLYKGTPVLDLDYDEDVCAEADMNVVMNDVGNFIEIQGTAENNGHLPRAKIDEMLTLATTGIKTLIKIQKEALAS